MFLNGYPYTDFHEMNADFILRVVQELKKAFAEFTASNSLIFAEPLLHSTATSYAKNTIVLDPDGNAYISLQNVPEGIQLSNADYWLMVFNFEEYTEKANKNFTNNYFRDTERTPYALVEGDWVVLNDVLYEVVADIPEDGLFIIGTNITHFTVEQFIKDFVASVTQTINDWHDEMVDTIDRYKDDIDDSEADYHAEMQAEVDRILAGATVDSEVIDARLGANGINYTTLGNAIRGQMGLTYFNRYVLADNSDLDDITYNSVYQIQAGASHIPDHYPADLGTSAGIVISNSMTGTDSYISQYAIGFSNYKIYARNKSGATWSDWTRINTRAVDLNNYYKNNGVMTAGSDLDDITTNSINQVASGSIPSHYPSALSNDAGVVVTNVFSGSNYLTQMVLPYSGNRVFFRSKSNTWSSWVELFDSEKYYGNIGVLAASSDLDNITTNSIYQVQTGQLPSHYPSGMGSDSGTVITNQFSGSTYVTQIVISYSGTDVYKRYKSGGTWSSWSKMNVVPSDLDGMYKNYGILAAGSDLDDIHVDSVYQIMSGQIPSNYPEFLDNSSGVIITNVFAAINNGYYSQYALGYSSGLVCFRTCTNGVWSDWKCTNYFRLDRKVKIFGDSVAYGYSADHDNDQSPYNLGAEVAKHLNLTADIQAVPGQGLITDWNDILTAIEADDFTNCVLILVNWAYNDSSQYSSINFGSPDDPTPTGTPTTYLGYYAYILNKLQKRSTYSKVILITGYGAPPNNQPTYTDQFTRQYTFADGAKTVQQMYDALEEMCHKKGFDCINQAKGSPINQSNYSWIIGDTIHPNYSGYVPYSRTLTAKVSSLFANM